MVTEKSFSARKNNEWISHENEEVKQAQPVQMNIYYNAYSKDLGWLHFNDTPSTPSVGKNISKHLLI